MAWATRGVFSGLIVNATLSSNPLYCAFFLYPSICQHLIDTDWLLWGTFSLSPLSYRLYAFYSYPEVNIRWLHVLYCQSVTSTFSLVAVPTVTSSSPPSYSLLPFSFIFTATLLWTPQLHPCPAILPSISSPFLLLSLHHPCLSFRAEAPPVKLILPLCWGAPSTHRLGFPLSLSLWPSVFLSLSLTVTSTFLFHLGVLSLCLLFLIRPPLPFFC